MAVSSSSRASQGREGLGVTCAQPSSNAGECEGAARRGGYPHDEVQGIAAEAAAHAVELEELVGGDADIAYEQELRRDPYQLKIWLAYLKSKHDAKPPIRFVLYERALRSLPGSYKLWRLYLLERVEACKDVNPVSSLGQEIFAATNDAFERALVQLSRMPEIWKMFLKFLQQQKLITRTRRTFDAALQSLAVTQHEMIWPDMIEYAKSCGVPETAVCLYRRWTMLEPERSDEFALYLRSVGRYDEAAKLLAETASDLTIAPASGRTRHELWLELCNLVAAHPEAIKSMRVEDVLRSGIARFSDAVGSLWCSLASHYVRMGLLPKARDVYEEAVSTVSTIRDLALVYEAYAAFEEAVVAQMLQQDAADPKEIDLSIARLERLTERRPLLVSSCKLRQNPHNVHEWLARAELLKDDPKKVVDTFTEAVATVKAEQSVGRLSVLWIAFARFYEAHDDVKNAAKVYERAVKVPFKTVDDLASVWCESVEMHLRHGLYKEALDLVRRAVNKPRNADAPPSQQRLYRSVKLWALAADVEEMFGSVQTVRACYDKMFQLKVITPQLVINYAHYLEERRYFEESYRVYERGVATFHWPHVNAIWLMYLSKFVSRYRSTKLERARELFQQATSGVPAKYAKNLFLLYAKLEEEYGLAKHALTIYRAAASAVLPEEKLDMYYVYIARTSELFGVARTRKIFEEAIETLPEKDVRAVCLRYAVVEKSLGEIDRARAIYQHASQLCDPSKDEEFWNAWRELEVAYGNEDTFKDMLRIKRSVMAQYSQVHHNVAELTSAEIVKPLPEDPVKEAAALLQQEDELREKIQRQEQALQEQMRFQEKQRTEMQELEQARAEFAQLQQSRRRAAVLASVPENSPYFIASKSCQNGRAGYVFKLGPQGLGFYLDPHQVGESFVAAREKSFVEESNPSKKSKVDSGQVAASEELEIDVDDINIEERGVPDTVFGSLKPRQESDDASKS